MAACPCGVQLSQLMRLLFLQGCMIVALTELAWSASAVQAAVVGENTNLNLRDEEISIRVEGKVYCDCCVLRQGFTRFSRSFLAGVRAAVECKKESGGASFVVAQTTTDERGQFMLDFSASVRNLDHLKNNITGLCSVRLLHNPHTPCNSLVTVSSNLLSFTSFRVKFVERNSAGQYSYQPPSLLLLSSTLPRPSDTAIAALSSKACNHRQAAVSISRKLLAASPHVNSEAVTTESLTLGPPDPPQPGDIPTKRASSLGPPSPYKSRLTP